MPQELLPAELRAEPQALECLVEHHGGLLGDRHSAHGVTSRHGLASLDNHFPAEHPHLAGELVFARALVADLRSLALADAPIRDQATVDLTGIINEAAEIVAALGELRNVAVQCDAAPGVTVRGDASRLKQVVLNLGDNAVKYTPSGGRVTLRLEASETSAILRVADTGIGISERDLPRLFDRLFRTDSAGQRAEGTGLGLAIAKRIVDVHRGTIDVQSRRGEGSTFTVRLPLS